MAGLEDEIPQIPILLTGEERKVILYHGDSTDTRELIEAFAARGYVVEHKPADSKEPVVVRGLNHYQGFNTIRTVFSL